MELILSIIYNLYDIEFWIIGIYIFVSKAILALSNI